MKETKVLLLLSILIWQYMFETFFIYVTCICFTQSYSDQISSMFSYYLFYNKAYPKFLDVLSGILNTVSQCL